MHDQLNIGAPCLAKLEDDFYPALYIEPVGTCHRVYLRHTDNIQKVSEIKEFEVIPLQEICIKIKYGEMESPAYFRLGTKLCLKFFGKSYITNSGKIVDIDQESTVDKITCALVL